MHPPFDYDALHSDGWVEWNRRTWGLEAERVRYRPDGESYTLSGVLFLDKRGRVRMPPLTSYLPFRFEPSGPERPERMTRQWLALGELFARDLRRRRVVGRIALPPSFGDARPFQWNGLVTETRYTYTASLPHGVEHVSPAVRKNINKATRAGYTFGTEVGAEEIIRSMRATSERKGFEYELDASTLTDALDRLGSLARTYAVRDTSGRVVSAGVRIVTPAGTAWDWVQGTEFEAMKTGAAQLMYRGVLDDLADQGAVSFDFGGANIPAVSAAKAAWGMSLTGYLTISEHDARQLYRTVRGALTRAVRQPPAS